MAENLRYDVPGAATLDTLNPANPSANYGRLYDWTTVMNGVISSSSNPSGVQGICPSGWYVPSDAELTELTNALTAPKGTTMKSTTGWNGGGNGTNRLDFNAFPAGNYASGSFVYLGDYADFWSSTEGTGLNAWERGLTDSYTGVVRYNANKTSRYSCRCVKD